MNSTTQQAAVPFADMDVRNCLHCGSKLAPSMVEFCCSGCETVFAVLKERGWDSYYRLRGQAQARPVGDMPEDDYFNFLGTEDYLNRFCKSLDDGRFQTTWFLSGLHCAACIWLVEKVLSGQKGIENHELRFSDGRLHLIFKAGTELPRIAAALAELGYRPGLQVEANEVDRGSMLRMGIAGALAANIMLMTVPFYTGLEQGSLAGLFAWLAFALSIPLLTYCSRPFFQKAGIALKHMRPTLDLPIAIGLIGAFSLSTFELIQGHYDAVYFDSMGMLVFFLLVGRYAQQKGVRRAMAAGAELTAEMPLMVETFRNGAWTQETAERLTAGDRIALRTGDATPIDATLLSEEAVLDLQIVNGESKPVRAKTGDAVPAGAVNMGGRVELSAAGSADAHGFKRYENLAKELLQEKRARQSGRTAGAFLVFAACAAVIAFIGPANQGDYRQAWTAVLTVFIVVCPCALALAGPTSRAFALRYAAKAGIWIKELGVFDVLPDLQQIVFDKTGILTGGNAELINRYYCSLNHKEIDARWIDQAVAGLERDIDHPIAISLKNALGKGKPATAIRVFPGSGVQGKVEQHQIAVGSLNGLRRMGYEESVLAPLHTAMADFHEAGALVGVVVDNQAAALFGFQDQLSDGAEEAVLRLQQRNINLSVLSGDQIDAVNAVADRLQISSRIAGALPERKLAFVKKLAEQPTMMVGDGYNDMGALSAATLGVTHARGTGAALQHADVILRDRNLTAIDVLIDIGTTAGKATRRGIAFSLAYNLTAIFMVCNGWIGPLAAAVLMPLSSLTMLAVTALTFHQRRSRWAS